MMRPFASSAPKRLAQAVRAHSAPSFATTSVRKMQDTADRVTRSGADARWISSCPDLKERDAVARSLTAWENTDRRQDSKTDQEKKFRKTPVEDLRPAQQRPGPTWLKPVEAEKPKPEATPCDVARALPRQISAAQVRLRTKEDPDQIALPAPMKRMAHRLSTPATSIRAVPEGVEQLWARKHSPIPGHSAATPRNKPQALPRGMAETKRAPWAYAVDGPEAPTHVLEQALRATDAFQSPAYGAKGGDTKKAVLDPSEQKTVQQNPAQHTASNAPAFGNEPSQIAKAVHTREVSNRPEPPKVVREPVHGPDPLQSETLSRPPHRTLVPLPAQPDLDPPFAEILTPERREKLGRFQEAVADEPLTDLPGRTQPRAPAGFDRDALSDALAQILRDEARRHGIDA